MKDLTINVIYTEGSNFTLPENKVLLKQLRQLKRLGFEIAILINGKDSQNRIPNEIWNDFINSKFKTYVSDDKFTHGAALNYLHDRCLTDWYINIDEDDEFTDVDEVKQLLESVIYLRKNFKINPNSLIMYGFNWIYESPNTKELKSLYHPTESNCSEIPSVASMSNWNFLFNKVQLDSLNLRRYDLNLMDDTLFYIDLYHAYKGECVLYNESIINYYKTRSTISKTQLSEDAQKYLDKLLERRAFKVSARI